MVSKNNNTFYTIAYIATCQVICAGLLYQLPNGGYYVIGMLIAMLCFMSLLLGYILRDLVNLFDNVPVQAPKQATTVLMANEPTVVKAKPQNKLQVQAKI